MQARIRHARTHSRIPLASPQSHPEEASPTDDDEDDEKALLLPRGDVARAREEPAGPAERPAGAEELPLAPASRRTPRLQFDADNPCLAVVHALACNMYLKVRPKQAFTEVLQLFHASGRLGLGDILNPELAEYVPRTADDLVRYVSSCAVRTGTSGVGVIHSDRSMLTGPCSRRRYSA